MIIFLYGPDSYRRNQKKRELIHAYKTKQKTFDMLFAGFDDDPEGWREAKDFLQQPSMFVDSKLLVVYENRAVDEKAEKAWIKVLKAHLESPKTFIVISDSEKPRKAFSFLFKDPVINQEFPKLEGSALEAFLRKEAAERALTFTPEAWRFFVDCSEANSDPSWRGINELDKLASGGFSQPLSLDVLQEVLAWNPRSAVFVLTRQMLGERSAQKKLFLLEQLFSQREDPSYIFNSLAYHASGSTAITFADYYIAIKSGRLEYAEALSDFALSQPRL